MHGLIGKKLGMTQVYDGNGKRVAVTVIEAGPCDVIQLKTREADGYAAAQLGFGDQKDSRLTRPVLGHIKKAGKAAKRVLREFRLDDGEQVNVGDTVTAAGVFEGVAFVDVSGMSKGQGFQGVVRRHRMAGGPLTHGGHSKRRVGSIGQCAFPSRVAKNQRMPGHMGHRRVTQQNLKVVQVRAEDNLLLVQGAIPGPNGAFVVVRRALKKAGKS